MARRNRENDYERDGTEGQLNAISAEQNLGGDSEAEGGDNEGGSAESVLETNTGDAANKKKGKSDEQKRADFKKLAQNRASDAFDKMTLLAHLANTTQYMWTEDQENAIFGALEDKVRMLRASFKAAREAAANRVPGERGKRTKAHSVIV